jgi:GTPase SAR1 family protein
VPPNAGIATPLSHALGVNRIAIVGPVASGKTTLAARLGSNLNLPVIDLDDYYWRQSPLPSEEDWMAQHLELVRGDRWIISGDYRAVADIRFQAADTVIWLDLSRTTCLWRATTRKLRGSPAPLLASWRWIWRYSRHGRIQTAAALGNPSFACSVHRLRSSSDVGTFLTQIAP